MKLQTPVVPASSLLLCAEGAGWVSRVIAEEPLQDTEQAESNAGQWLGSPNQTA